MKNLAAKKNFLASAQAQTVEYLTPDEVYAIADTIRNDRNGERNSLLILTLFETGLRISEALSITPAKIEKHGDGYLILIKTKPIKLYPTQSFPEFSWHFPRQRFSLVPSRQCIKTYQFFPEFGCCSGYRIWLFSFGENRKIGTATIFDS